MLTHCHEDHAGSAAEVRGWGEVEVLAHRLDAQVISTPGHTEGSIAIWLPARGVLFTGDLVANGANGLLLGPFNTDRTRARELFARLAQTPADLVCFGHGEPLTGPDGAAAWRALGARCQGGPDTVPDPLG